MTWVVDNCVFACLHLAALPACADAKVLANVVKHMDRWVITCQKATDLTAPPAQLPCTLRSGILLVVPDVDVCMSQRLCLLDSSFPIGCLPYLGQLRGLEVLFIDLDRCTGVDTDSLEAVLLGLCCAAPSLKGVNLWNKLPGVDVVLEKVRQALSSSGRRAVELMSWTGLR